MNENNKNIDEFVNDLTKSIDFQNSTALYIILKTCILDVGLDKRKLMNRIREMSSNFEIEKISKVSIINKQFLRNYNALDEKNRKDLLEKVMKKIEQCRTQNGVIDISKNIIKENIANNIENVKKYNIKNNNVAIYLPTEYAEKDIEKFDFCASNNLGLEISIRAFHFDSSKYRREYIPEVNKSYIKRIINTYHNDLNDNFNELKIIEPLRNKNEKIKEKIAIGSLLSWRFYDKDISIVEYSGIDIASGIEKCVVLSVILFSGDICGGEYLSVAMVQSCNIDEYEKNHKMIMKNIENTKYCKIEDKKVEYIEVFDDDLGKILIDREGVLDCKKLKSKYKNNECAVPISLDFEYRIKKFNRISYLNNKSNNHIHIENLKVMNKSKDEIIKSILKVALEQSYNEEEGFEDITIFTSIIIGEKEISIECLAYYWEDTDPYEYWYTFDCKKKTLKRI